MKVPDSGHSAAFVKSIRSRYKGQKGTKILNYLMKQANEYNANSDKSSGYSEVRIPFDTVSGEDMKPEQRLAFMLRVKGVNTQLVREALGEMVVDDPVKLEVD